MILEFLTFALAATGADAKGCTVFENKKTYLSPGTATHPVNDADIVIGTEADWGEYNYISNGVLGGFDIELTEMVCRHAGVKCAIVTVPWQSVWPKEYADFGWATNSLTYPGVGSNNQWFHCSSGTRNIIPRQQSTAFTDPYTDMSVDTAGFVTAHLGFPSDAAGTKIGILASQAYTVYFKSQMGEPPLKYNVSAGHLTEYNHEGDLWADLKKGNIDAVYTGNSEATSWLAKNRNLNFTWVHAEAGWSRGVAYGCRPEFGDVVAILNMGLVAFKATYEYYELCSRYHSITCDTRGSTFSNIKTREHPATADHPSTRAQVVIGTEADWGEHNYIRDGVLGGFDIELTKHVCEHAGLTCAIVTVPWHSVWPDNYTDLGWATNPKTYPGVGMNNKWFHCSVGTRNTIERQQSIAYTDPYTDVSVDTAGFITTDLNFPKDAAGRRIGILAAQGYTMYFKSQMGPPPSKYFVSSDHLIEFNHADDMWKALETYKIGAVFTGVKEARDWLSKARGYVFMHGEAGWSRGVAYGCSPEFGDIVAALNMGLQAFKATEEYTDLCERYSSITCDTQNATFANIKTPESPTTATHPAGRADIVIGTEADWGQYNYIKNGVLGGFDLELTSKVCEHARIHCAIVTVPWQSVWPKAYADFGWPSNAPKTYPGVGLNNVWFHCSVGTRNIIARQQSTAFTDPYTDMSVDTAGFVTSNLSFPADAAGKKIGILAAQAFTVYFKSQMAAPLKYSNVSAEHLFEYDHSEDLWMALQNYTLDAVFTGQSEADDWRAVNPGFAFMHAEAGWSRGVAYGCRPEFGHAVAALNSGLVAFKATQGYTDLCAKYSAITCDTASATFVNKKTRSHPENADHPSNNADIVIGTEADWGEYNYIKDGVLGGFDIELTEKVCQYAGVSCAIVTVPWQSVWPKAYANLGWHHNTKTYPGVGTNNQWFHCSSGTRNILARQQSTAFTDPYTDMNNDTAGFVTAHANFPDDGSNRRIGILAAQAFTVYFKSQLGLQYHVHPAHLTEFNAAADLWASLKNGSIDAVYTGSSEAVAWLADNSGYMWMHPQAGWSQGVAYGCRPEFGDKVAALNRGLAAFKETTEYQELCDKYPSIKCDCEAPILTCGDIKRAYMENSCCKAPETIFGMPDESPRYRSRRLSTCDAGAPLDEGTLPIEMKQVLQDALLEGGPSKSTQLAKELQEVLRPYLMMEQLAKESQLAKQLFTGKLGTGDAGPRG